MEIRVQRTIAVLPQHARSFIQLALQTAEHSKKVMGISSEIFYSAHANDSAMEFKVFTDFESMAVYEKRFLGDLLHSADYLNLAASAVDMIRDEPHDEMFVRLQPDDFFLNLGAPAKRRRFAFEKAKAKAKVKAESQKPTRFRRVREYGASKGRLREVMQMNFQFMEHYFLATGRMPKYFCTRFSGASRLAPDGGTPDGGTGGGAGTSGRIGSSLMYFDVDDCPQCTPAFIEQDEDIARNRAGLLLRAPADHLLTRIDASMVNFSIAKLAG